MKILSMFAVAAAMSVAAFGQLSPRYIDWTDGPVRHLMTKEEMSQWKSLHSDPEAAAFIDLFWARRDPTPDTPRNEFHEEFDARVLVADEKFSSAKMRGAMSDPGRVLILLGLPWQVAGRGTGESLSTLGAGRRVPTDSQGNVLVPSPRAEPPRQVWTYAHARKPKFIRQSDFVLVFVDEGNNEWQLARTERINSEAVLLQAVKGLIVSPGMTRPPVFAAPPVVHSKEFKSAELKRAFESVRATGNGPSGPVQLTWGEFVSPEGAPFISVQLYAPAGSGLEPAQKVTFFGVIEDGAGQIVEVVEESSSMIASGQDAYFDKSLRLEPGTYSATFGLAGVDGKIVSATRTAVTVDPPDSSGVGISPLILSSNVYPLSTPWEGTDPFIFGGLKVVPKGDAVFRTKGDLWYFVELRNPGVSGEGAPNVQVQVDITGKTANGRAEMKFPMQRAEVAKLKGTTDRYAVGTAIPLEGFIPGDYTIKVRLIDAIANRKYELEKAFTVKGM